MRCSLERCSLLSPYFFASYIDDIVDIVKKEYHLGCYIKGHCVTILLYADDIILIAPTVMGLQKLFNIVESELAKLDMKINASKSYCIVGPRYDSKCADISTSDGHVIEWTDEIRYLGVFIVCDKCFSCLFCHAKRSFYRSFNAIFGKIGRIASDDVLLQLVETKCIPALLYGLDACPINKAQINSLQYAVTGMLMKLFKTKSKDVIQDCTYYFNFLTVEHYLFKRKYNFLFNFVRNTSTFSYIFNAEARDELASVSEKLCAYYV